MVNGPKTESLPASALRGHPDVVDYCRIAVPWAYCAEKERPIWKYPERYRFFLWIEVWYNKIKLYILEENILKKKARRGIVVLSLLRPLVNRRRRWASGYGKKCIPMIMCKLIITAVLSRHRCEWGCFVERQYWWSADPASMSKLMTLYLLSKPWKKGKITKDTVVTARSIHVVPMRFPITSLLAGGLYYFWIDYHDLPFHPPMWLRLCYNLLSNHDADAFIQRMNWKSKELGWPQYNLEQSERSGHFNLPRLYTTVM